MDRCEEAIKTVRYFKHEYAMYSSEFNEAFELLIQALRERKKRLGLIRKYKKLFLTAPVEESNANQYYGRIVALEECEVSDGIEEVGYRDKDDVLVLPKEMDEDWSE